MLNVILKILSLIGILLLIVLGVLLVTLLFVLFFPVGYRLRGCRSAQETTLSFRAAWLFGLLRVSYDYPDPGRLTVRILWHKLSARQKEEESAPQYSSNAPAEEDDATSGESSSTESVISPKQDEDTDGAAQENASSVEKNTGIRYTIRQLYDKIRKTWENINDYAELLREDETKQLFSHIVFRFSKLLRHIRPRRLKAELLYGTGSPDTTGYLFGLYGVLSPSLGKRVSVTPDFERTVFEGTVDAAGHITAAVLLVNACSVLLDKKLRKFIKKAKRTGRN